MNLEEKLYTSTEVAEILGVSLRSVYRYLDEGKIQAEVKTATGRHRFTKQNILDFLYPDGAQTAGAAAPAKEPKEEPKVVEKEVKEEVTVEVEEPAVEAPAEPAPAEAKVEPEEETIDWLEKFRAAASKYKEEEAAKVQVEETPVEEAPVEPAPAEDMTLAGTAKEEAAPQKEEDKQFAYYRSLAGGLKDIAQNIDKSAKKASIDYAFTMNAGLSLHKPIKPFSLLHAYIRPEDKEFFERMLNLVPSNESNAQLALISTKEKTIFDNSREMHGLNVVSDIQLKNDLLEYGEEQLAKEFDASLSS
jgi:excisionase family DNA binding protein